MWRPERSQTAVGHVSHAGVGTTGRLGVATFQKETLLASSVADNREGGTSHPFGSVVGRMSALAYPHPWKWGKSLLPPMAPHTPPSSSLPCHSRVSHSLFVPPLFGVAPLPFLFWWQPSPNIRDSSKWAWFQGLVRSFSTIRLLPFRGHQELA